MLTFIESQSALADPVGAPANAIAETTFAWLHGNTGDARYAHLAQQFSRYLADGTLEALPMDRAAAELAGEIRARLPNPPGKRKGVTKVTWHRNWVTDIQIAATTWTAGYDIHTANHRDFDAISEVIAHIAPGAPALSVLPPPPGI